VRVEIFQAGHHEASLAHSQILTSQSDLSVETVITLITLTCAARFSNIFVARSCEIAHPLIRLTHVSQPLALTR